MKKLLLLFTFTQFFLLHLNAQMSNTAFGSGALSNNVSGSFHTAIGDAAMLTNTSGEFNTATGASSQAYGVTWAGGTNGSYNSSHGGLSLYNNYGFYNTGNGYRALYVNTSGGWNSANGAYALYYNSTGYSNTANGIYSSYSNTSGGYNVADGSYAMFSNTTGSNNSVGGSFALYSNITGNNNTAYGYGALYLTTGDFNVGLGYWAGANSAGLSNTTALGNGATITASNQVRIGNSAVTSIGGQVRWSTLSDGRFKRDIKEDIAGLDFINKLRPVSYTVDKTALNTFLGIPDSITKQMPQARKAQYRETGFVAQEVEAIVKSSGYAFNGVQAPQNNKDHYSIAYDEFVVPLVKAVQELTAITTEQQKKIDQLLSQLNMKGDDVKSHGEQGSEVVLFQNAPNPFTVDTEISMMLPETVNTVTIMVYALDGKEIKSIPVTTRGKAIVKISAYELSAGMYIYALIADSKIIDTKRMILTK